MTTYDTNLLTLHISKLAAIQVIQNTSSIVLRKQCCKKLNEKFIPVQTEIDLTSNELQLLSKAAKLALYSLSASEEANKSKPSKVPGRNTN